jgi:hypothetical protein
VDALAKCAGSEAERVILSNYAIREAARVSSSPNDLPVEAGFEIDDVGEGESERSAGGGVVGAVEWWQ